MSEELLPDDLRQIEQELAALMRFRVPAEAGHGVTPVVNRLTSGSTSVRFQRESQRFHGKPSGAG